MIPGCPFNSTPVLTPPQETSPFLVSKDLSFLDSSYKWNHTLCSCKWNHEAVFGVWLFSLSVTLFKLYLHCSEYQSFSPFHGWITFHLDHWSFHIFPIFLCWLIVLLFVSLKFFFCLLRVTPVAYGGSQDRGLIRATAAGLHQSHSNARSEPHLQPTVKLKTTSDP